MDVTLGLRDEIRQLEKQLEQKDRELEDMEKELEKEKKVNEQVRHIFAWLLTVQVTKKTLPVYTFYHFLVMIPSFMFYVFVEIDLYVFLRFYIVAVVVIMSLNGSGISREWIWPRH